MNTQLVSIYDANSNSPKWYTKKKKYFLHCLQIFFEGESTGSIPPSDASHFPESTPNLETPSSSSEKVMQDSTPTWSIGQDQQTHPKDTEEYWTFQPKEKSEIVKQWTNN